MRKKETVITEENQKELKEVFEKIIDNKSTVLTVDALSPNDNPVTITLEFFRRMQDMAKTSGGNPMMMEVQEK